MGQDLVIICHKCKTVTWFLCRFYNIKKSEVQEYFYQHKGHEIRVIGDDGGWDMVIGDYLDKGFKSIHFKENKKEKEEK